MKLTLTSVAFLLGAAVCVWRVFRAIRQGRADLPISFNSEKATVTGQRAAYWLTILFWFAMIFVALYFAWYVSERASQG
ncbi:MAG: hypothetical protein QOF05_134 [Sphingomonadales bacterium]|jgi:hypothetical protein|nr:hypothetical protein [Sphingomonadales bacterium]